ncbi:unnamed protein product [Cylicostephanus goldi]|uniref:PABS domain-containing protein n=1 Tax=Cylicostephanus goldi TaxID=71465 RepID=A0A3P6RAS3_CYLGO|nr:unnamed protein product [Cylicostephanus goldi]
MFTSGAISINRKVSASVLSLGLGGGYLNSYLHHNYRNLNITVVEYDPQMLNISQKWCGLRLDEMHRVVVEDGTEFVKNCADRGEKYDVIFLDACHLDHSSMFICPAQKFVAAYIAIDFASILKSNAFILLVIEGVLIINVLGSRQQTFSEAPKELLRIYNEAFKHCIFKKSHSPSNLVMTCAQYPIEKNLREMYEGFANYSYYGGHVSEEWFLPGYSY